MTIEYRPVTPAEFLEYRRVVNQGFGYDSTLDDAFGERLAAILPAERTVAAFDRSEIVATLGDFPLSITLPGGRSVAMAGTTAVVVRATHRRRGILRELMRAHLRMAHERGEPLVGLTATETAIYGRFGFGLAAEAHVISIDNRQVQVAAPTTSTELAEVAPTQLFDVVVPAFARWQRLDLAGFVHRPDSWWHHDVADQPEERGGRSAMRHVVAKRGDQVVGYVAYRQAPSKPAVGLHEGTIHVSIMVAEDIDAHRSLWHLVTHIDLHPNVVYDAAPVDDPVTLESSEQRGIRRSVVDTLWLRVVDVERVLTERRYELDGRVVLGVADADGYGDGTFDVAVEDGRAIVQRTDAEPQVQLGIAELGALALGRDIAPQLARVGKLQGDDKHIVTAARLLRTSRAPWCSDIF